MIYFNMEKFKIDPDKVIKVEPRKIKTPPPIFTGFMHGWFSQKEKMKVKLLKKLRKQFAWKCVQRDAGGFMVDEWALLYIDQNIITFHSSSEQALYCMLNTMAPEYREFNYWNRLLGTHVNKMTRREFNRIGNKTTRRQAPPPPFDRKGQKI